MKQHSKTEHLPTKTGQLLRKNWKKKKNQQIFFQKKFNQLFFFFSRKKSCLNFQFFLYIIKEIPFYFLLGTYCRMSFWKGCIKPSKLHLSKNLTRRLQALALLPPQLSHQRVNMCNSSMVAAVFKNKTKNTFMPGLWQIPYGYKNSRGLSFVGTCCSIQWISVQRDCSCIDSQNDSEFFFLFGLLHKFLAFWTSEEY